MSRLIVRLLCPASLIVACSSVAVAGPYDFTGTSGKIAHFHLGGVMTEAPRVDPLGLGFSQTTTLKELLERLAKARKDESVKAVVLTFEGMGIGAGQLEELRDAIKKFKAVDKRVFVHVNELNTGSLVLMAAASDLSIVPTADVWLTGLYLESLYVKGLFDKLGLEADILHIGDYKSAGEMLTQTGPSEEAAANINWLLDGLFESFVNMIAESREISEDRVRRLIDDGLYSAEQALEEGLVDSVKYRDEFLAEIKKIYGEDIEIDNRYGDKDALNIDLSSPFAFFSILSDMFNPIKKSGKDSIAIVYVEGIIQPGHAQPSPFGGSSGAFSGDIAKALEKAANDRSVKAVVLRVDSPGGSALASEIIWRATQLVKAKKPMIVSMGNVAGSGGYYVACGADDILADETTITASIGVVGGKIITTGMWDKCGINWVAYKRGANADLMSSARRFTDQQEERVKRWMTDVYDHFKKHVVEGRKGKLQKPIEELAGGRVFTGKQALELGLVDKIGGLADAVEHAARKASISDYEVRVIPEPKNFLDMLMSQLTGRGDKPSDISVRMRPRLFEPTSPLLKTIVPMLHRLDPERTRAVLQALSRIELIHREGVITMMPREFVIR